VDLNQSSTCFSGEFPGEPLGFDEFIFAVSNSYYSNSVFKLKGIGTTATTINLDYFYSLEQWVSGEPWRIKANNINIGASKKVIGGILYAPDESLSGDIVCDDSVEFYSCYLKCQNLKSVIFPESVRLVTFHGCTAEISDKLYFENSQMMLFNSIFKINAVNIAGYSTEEIILRSSVTNLSVLDFTIIYKERSDNNTNQLSWLAPVSMPAETFIGMPTSTYKWDTCIESDFNFSGIQINSSGNPYIDYELGLYGSEREDLLISGYDYLGLGATGALKTTSYIDFYVDTSAGSYPYAIKFSPVISVITKVIKFTWYFGDGLKSTATFPTHTYQHGGNFTPILEVLFEDGKRFKKVKKDLIEVFKISIIPSENKGAAPLSVNFSVVPALPMGVDIGTFDWDFGDGTTHSSETGPLHLYTDPNTYSVRLTNTFTIE
jgi:hypothetical protein